MIVGMNHFTVIAEDRQKTLDFYVGLLGLKRRPAPRPRLRRRLALRRRHAGDPAPLLRPAEPPAQRAGVIDHMAFTRQRPARRSRRASTQRGVKYDLRRQAGAGTWQLFSYDPNGAKVELDFDPAESL